MSVRTRRMTNGGVALVCAVVFARCTPPRDDTLPTPEQVVSYYTYDGGLEAEVVGNVVVLRVAQSPDLLRRGGPLWAKVGPYIFLFSEETQRLFEDFGGVAGVRVVTRSRGTEVANALLAHEELNEVQWARARNISGRARLEGTKRMTLLEDLVEWGESHTEFTYNTSFTRR